MTLARLTTPRPQRSPNTPARVELPAVCKIAGIVAHPLSGQEWVHVVSSLGLAPQEARLVELILRGKRDKQIATELNLRAPTVRTYLTRIFQRTGCSDRVELVLRVFACARSDPDKEACHQK